MRVFRMPWFAQLPLCYHPSIEYQLDELVAQGTSSAYTKFDVVFPGVVAGKRRREEIVRELEAAGVTVKVCSLRRPSCCC
jgi:hypothetical protein